jgi:hypothetical protein
MDAAQRVGRRVGQRWQPATGEPVGGLRTGLADDLRDALARDPATACVGERVGVGIGASANAAQTVEVRDELLDELVHLRGMFAPTWEP